LTLCYNCRRLGHIDKECPGIGPICICFKTIGHEVEDFSRMIDKVEKMNMRQEKYKEGQETKDMLENQKEKESAKAQTMLKEVMDDHRDINLLEILKEKQCIVTRIEYFDMECVLDEETHVNIMPESTWEILGRL
jgi:uncharacterized membrane-anchored protein YjiN (DUF445 family)